MRIFSVLSVALLSTLLLDNTTAHGGGASDGLSNMQITIAAIVLCATSYFAIPKFLGSDKRRGKNVIYAAVVYTGAVHIMLGLDDVVFMLGGIGIIGFGFAPLVLKFAKNNEKIFQLGLSFNALIMFIAYFVSNHDLHYLLEDYLGLTTKVSEIVIMALVVRQLRGNQSNLQR